MLVVRKCCPLAPWYNGCKTSFVKVKNWTLQVQILLAASWTLAMVILQWSRLEVRATPFIGQNSAKTILNHKFIITICEPAGTKILLYLRRLKPVQNR